MTNYDSQPRNCELQSRLECRPGCVLLLRALAELTELNQSWPLKKERAQRACDTFLAIPNNRMAGFIERGKSGLG